MYLVYSLHPTTFKLTARSIHRDHNQAISALVKQSHDYITKYRGHKDLQVVKNLEEIEQDSHPAGFYYLITDDIDDRLIIYEKKQLSGPGYLSKAQYQIQPYLIFSVTLLPFFDDQTPGNTDKQVASLMTPIHVQKLENIKPDQIQVQQANYMTELHALLKKRGGPVESDVNQPVLGPSPALVGVTGPLTPIGVTTDQELLTVLGEIEQVNPM